MQRPEFVDELYKLWPRAFQPRETWHDEILKAVADFSASQLESALTALKMKHAGRAIDLETVLKACRSAPSVTALAGKPTGLKREPGADIRPFLDWLRAQGLSEAFHRAPTDQQVYASRLFAVLWGESREAELAAVSGNGQPWERVERIARAGLAHPDCQTRSSRGWSPPWSSAA